MKTFVIALGIIIPAVLIYLMVAREMKFKLIKGEAGVSGAGEIFSGIKKMIRPLLFITPSEEPDEVKREFASRTLWACAAIGAIGFHFFHAWYPLLVALVIRSFFLPTTSLSVALRWIYILGIIAFALIPGVEDGVSGLWGRFTATTTQWGNEMKDPKTPGPAEIQAPQAQGSMSTSHTEQRRSQERTVEVTAEPGVFTDVQIPPGAYFKLEECPADVVIVVTGDDGTEEKHDCAWGDIHFNTNVPGFHMRVASKTQPVELVFTTWR